ARFRTIPEPISPAPTKPIRTRATIPAGGGEKEVRAVPTLDLVERRSDAQEARDAVPERREPPNCRAGGSRTTLGGSMNQEPSRRAPRWDGPIRAWATRRVRWPAPPSGIRARAVALRLRGL